MFDQMQLMNLQAIAANSTFSKVAVEFSKGAASNVHDSFAVPNRNLVKRTLNDIFPTQKEENSLQRARRILGDIATNMPDQDLEAYLAEFEYLIDSWLDEFEKNIFDDKTLMQLLKEG